MRRPSLLALLAVTAVLLTAAFARAQDPVRREAIIPDRWLQGFNRAVGGELLVYPWAYPGQARALLTRTTTGRMAVEWEGEPVPAGVTDERVTYLWHAGMASGYGAHHFSFAVNGRPCATFTSGRNTGDREWVIEGVGCTLSFKTTRVGTFDELFGFMLVTLPRAAVAGPPPRFTVIGEGAANDDYYMTFQEPVRSWARATAEEARFRDGSRVLGVEFSRVGADAAAAVRIAGETLWQGTVTPGYSSVVLPIRTGGSVIELNVLVDGAPVLSQRVALAAVRAWEIHLLPHSHVDVGYSDPQPVVEQKQWKNLRDAVALAGKTRGYPPEARFKWNVEGLWSVESYLRQADASARNEFLAAAREGVIDLQANYTNILTGISTPEELARWTDGARRLQQEYGLGAMPTAMHTDIPGLSWTVVRALAQAGVRYFSSGPNYMPGLPDRGDRIGGTLRALGDRPFWWESPSGEERLLFWMAGRGYSWFHGMNLGRLEDDGRRAFFEYLRELEVRGYPYDMVQVRYTVGGDNGPVDPRLPDFVRSWNERFETPRLVIDTAQGLFAAFEQRYGAALPSYRGDMTPYWEDGAASSAGEEAMARGAARRLQQAEAVWSLRNPSQYPVRAFSDAWRDVTMWHEHTWGAADSVSQPDRADVVAQWNYKRDFAVNADRRSRALLDAGRSNDGDLLEAINTLSWVRNELLLLDRREAAGNARAVDETGRAYPSQRLSDGRLAVWLASVPALGARRLQLVAGEAERPPRPVVAQGFTLDNGRLRISVDPATGAIRSLQTTDIPAGELVSGLGMNAYRYVPGMDPASAGGPEGVKVTVQERGPLVATLRAESAAPGARRLVRLVTLVAGDDRVRLETIIDKLPVRDKESAHLAFGVNLQAPALRVDQGEALVTMGRDQLPGSCVDFVGPHSAVDLSSEAWGVSVATLDAPLIQPGAMTDERRVDGAPRAWRTTMAPGGVAFGYLLNNYWHTNYKAQQEGQLRFRFVVKPHGPFDPAALRRFGAEVDQPLVAARTSSSTTPVPPPFRLEGTPVMVSALRPLDDGRGLLVRLYNPTPAAASATLVALWRGRVVTVAAPGDRRVAKEPTFRLAPFGSLVLEIRRQPLQSSIVNRH